MKLKVYQFKIIYSWAKELNNACNLFYAENGCWPNIMLASELTYKRIDLVANSKPENIKGKGSSPEAFVSLSGFAAKDYKLDMCLDAGLKDLKFRLIYESDEDEGEPLLKVI